MNSNIHIRKVNQQDISQICEIEKLGHLDPWTQGIFNDCLRVGYEFWLLEERRPLSKLVGYGVMSVKVGEAHLMNLCITPHKRYQGYGKKLLSHLITIAKQNAADYLFLEVRKSNLPAINLYEKFGFNSIGERKNYYATLNGREDAIIFALSLGSVDNLFAETKNEW